MTPIQSLRYLQGFGLGDGWVYSKLARFKIHVYDPRLAQQIREMSHQVKVEFGLLGSESERDDRLTGTHEWRFELGGPFAVRNLDMSAARLPEGAYFIAGLWDADGGWYDPDESHPLGQARFFGGSHRVRAVKHALKHQWSISTGRKYLAIRAGHTSKIGDHTIVTRKNVYGTGILSKGMKKWIEVVGTKMILKRQSLADARED
jgi:hypothetical protein